MSTGTNLPDPEDRGGEHAADVSCDEFQLPPGGVENLRQGPLRPETVASSPAAAPFSYDADGTPWSPWALLMSTPAEDNPVAASAILSRWEWRLLYDALLSRDGDDDDERDALAFKLRAVLPPAWGLS